MTKPFTVEQLRCLELARIIREGLPGVKFNMNTYCRRRDDCETAGCIAGYACAAYDSAAWQSGSQEEIVPSATKLLGLSVGQTNALFEPWLNGGPTAPDIPPAMAAATLERFALTGEVVWK